MSMPGIEVEPLAVAACEAFAESRASLASDHIATATKPRTPTSRPSSSETTAHIPGSEPSFARGARAGRVGVCEVVLMVSFRWLTTNLGPARRA